jgi:D-alanine-D-alanine ligase
MNKLRVGLVFGGKSGEYEVSLRSAESIRNCLDKKKYQILDILIDRHNKFDPELLKKADVVFPVVHGSFGEDGSLQGMLEMMDKPYVGAGVLGSAVGMDKDVQKRLLKQAGIPVAKYQVIHDIREKIYDMNYPVFVKPANMGSSVGVSKVMSYEFMVHSLEKAFQYDTKVLIEEAVEGRELEVSVLGNENPVASIPGEVVPKGHEFYDYEAKYIDENGAELVMPAKLQSDKVTEIQRLAIKTFKVLEGSGMARVDMFLRPNGQLVVNEINTLPGFTNISMYPKLWEVSGLPYPKLLDRLIGLALEKKRGKDKLKRSYA